MLVTAYRNGVTMGTPPGKVNHEPPKRGVVNGWSAAAVRRHTKWLYGVSADELTGSGYAFTLTIRDCPPSAVEWHSARRDFIKRLERVGLLRFHWVTEWQRRKVPHLHGVVYLAGDFDDYEAAALIIGHWLAVTTAYGSRSISQDVKPVDGAVGWLQYLSKHAARGVAHYQRMGKPDGWAKTGRLWGKGGDWPESEPLRFDVDRVGGYRLRRLVRSWRVADARAALARQEANPVRDPAVQRQQLQAARRRVVQARRMLRCTDPALSPVRGVSEWVDEETLLSLLWLIVADGHGIVQRSSSPGEGDAGNRDKSARQRAAGSGVGVPLPLSGV